MHVLGVLAQLDALTIRGEIMIRILRPGPRPFVAFSIMCGLLLCLPLLVGVKRGDWSDSAKMAVTIFALYGVLCFVISRNRIIVATDFIAVKPPFGPQQRVSFCDIKASVPAILAEPDHPISLAVYCGQKQPTLRIHLKLFRKADIAWLLSLPELKVKT